MVEYFEVTVEAQDEKSYQDAMFAAISKNEADGHTLAWYMRTDEFKATLTFRKGE